MSSDSSRSPLWLRIAAQALLNMGLIWLLATYLPQFFTLAGGWRAIVVVGALLTLLNIFFRPFLSLLAFPLKLFATILAVIVVNGIFIEAIHRIVLRMDPSVVRLEIGGGLLGWVVVALVLGTGNWIIREMTKKE